MRPPGFHQAGAHNVDYGALQASVMVNIMYGTKTLDTVSEIKKRQLSEQFNLIPLRACLQMLWFSREFDMSQSPRIFLVQFVRKGETHEH